MIRTHKRPAETFAVITVIRFVLAAALAISGVAWAPAPLSATPGAVEFRHLAPAGWVTPFAEPTSVDVSPDGSIWVADRSAHRVRKLDASGTELISLGTGSPGGGNGELTLPHGVSVSPDGSRIYVSEQATATIKRVQVFDASGAYVSQITSAGGTAFGILAGVHVDGDGIVYAVDQGRRTVSVFDAGGAFVRNVGSVAVADGELLTPTDVVTGPGGVIYVLDRTGTTTAAKRGVKVYSAAGAYLRRIGTGGTASGTLGLRSDGVSLDASGNVCVADMTNNRVTRFTADTGAHIDQWSASGAFDVGFDAAGRAYTVNQTGKNVQRWFGVGAGAVSDATYPTPPTTPGAFNRPRGIAVASDGSLFVADTSNNRVQRFDSEGAYRSLVTTWGPGTLLDAPRAIAVEPAGTVLVGDASNRVIRYTADLRFLSEFGLGVIGAAGGIAVTAGGRVFVSDPVKNCVHEFGADGAVVSRWPADDVASPDAGDFSAPRGIAVAPGGTLWVADTGNSRLQQFSLDGSHLRTASTFPNGSLMFSQPSGVAVRADGTVWVTDAGIHRIHRLSSTGVSDYSHWGGPGAGVGINRFNAPEGIAAGPAGEIYVADTGGSHLMRAIVAAPDTTPPVITVSGVPDGWVRGPVQVTLSALDGTTPCEVRYSLTGAEPTTLVTGPVTISAEGTTTLRYSSRDLAGNEATGSATILIDNTGPVISHDAPAGWVSDAVGVTVQAVDAGVGLERVEHRLPGDDWSEGASFLVTTEGLTRVDVRARDLLGNVSTATVEVRIDTSGIAVFSSAPEEWGQGPVTVELWSSTGAPIRWGMNPREPEHLFTAGIEVNEEGVTSINFAAERPSGALTPTRLTHVLIDRSAPWVWDDAPRAPVRGPVTVGIGADDAWSGVLFVEHRLDGGAWRFGDGVLVSSEGATLLEYRATDRAGLVSEVGSATVLIDNTAPDASDDAPAGWVRGPVAVTLTLIGDGAIRYSLDGSSPSRAYEEPLSITAQGTTRIRYLARDSVGNVGPAREAYVRIDDTPPVLAHTAEASYEGTATFSLSASDALSGVATLRYRINGGEWIQSTSSPLQVAPLSVVGSHVVEYRATDDAGNEAISLIEFSVSAPPPVIPDLQPPLTVATGVPEGWSRSDVSVTLSATDDVSGIDATYYRIDAGDVVRYDAPVVFREDGIRTITFWSVDRSGRTEGAVSATVSIDKTAPSDVAPVGVTSLSTTSLRLSWTESQDEVSGVDRYLITDESGREMTTTTHGLHVSALVPGATKAFRVRAVDVAGNVSPEATAEALLPLSEVSSQALPGDNVRSMLRIQRLAGEGAVGTATVTMAKVLAPGSVTISRFSDAPTHPPAGTRLFAPGISVGFDGESSGQKAIAVPYDPRLPSNRALKLTVMTYAGGQWRVVEKHLDTTKRTLTLYPTTFTTFWIFEPTTVSTTAKFGVPTLIKVGYAESARITAKLVDSGGTPLPGFRVALQRRSGTDWVRVATMSAVSGSPGSYTTSQRAWADTRAEYRTVLENTALYTAEPASTVVLPKAKLSAPKAPSTSLKKRVPFLMTGSMAPAHSAPVKLYLERYSSGRWRAEKFVSVTTSSTGGYRAKVALRSGTWRVRATHLDAGHRASTSAWSRTFAVR